MKTRVSIELIIEHNGDDDYDMKVGYAVAAVKESDGVDSVDVGIGEEEE